MGHHLGICFILWLKTCFRWSAALPSAVTLTTAREAFAPVHCEENWAVTEDLGLRREGPDQENINSPPVGKPSNGEKTPSMPIWICVFHSQAWCSNVLKTLVYSIWTNQPLAIIPRGIDFSSWGFFIFWCFWKWLDTPKQQLLHRENMKKHGKKHHQIWGYP